MFTNQAVTITYHNRSSTKTLVMKDRAVTLSQGRKLVGRKAPS
jgi:membrane-bound inhibitor of C-type lysozyme